MSFGGLPFSPYRYLGGPGELPAFHLGGAPPVNENMQWNADEKAASSGASEDLHKGSDLDMKKEAATYVTGCLWASGNLSLQPQGTKFHQQVHSVRKGP